jgi:putative CocE/NonD family hydrolase
MQKLIIASCFFLFSSGVFAQTMKEDSTFVRQNFTKIERMIPMRDGVKLFTAIYIPIDQSGKYPFLMQRTPYSCSPYGAEKYPYSLSSNQKLLREKFIFVTQDVRGRYMSEGNFEEMTPHKAVKKSKKETDESTDTFDTVEWLLKNIKNNNGNVGILGISYPGFYASAALPDAHPAIKAVSPQAPVTDEFIGDDAYHNGAFFVMDNFSFMNYFDTPRTGPQEKYEEMVDVNFTDAYNFYLELGPLKNVNEKYFHERGKTWNEYLQHATYDDYWKARNIRTHLKNVKPAVLVVGGWFDAEDLFGALRTYEAIEKQTPQNNNKLVMGPWTHGGWARRDWSKYASHDFGTNVNAYYKDELESKFFNFYLKAKGSFDAKEATVFETGSNQWKSFDSWPPKNSTLRSLYFHERGKLAMNAPTSGSSFDEYVADPAKPVPYMDTYQPYRNNEYMAADQRFASTRPDVMTYVSDILESDMTLAGPLQVELFFSTTGTDSDFVVKLIDVLPETTSNPSPNPRNIQMAGLQQMVRGDVFRGKFRNSFEKPEPFEPGKITEVKFQLNDVSHTFKKGHKIMIQVQHSWFPLVDRNPQKFMDIPKAEAADFQKATLRLYHDKDHASRMQVMAISQ